MDSVIGKKWVETLRSGTYRQWKGSLKVTPQHDASYGLGGHCCLGVLCEVLIEAGRLDLSHNKLDEEMLNGFVFGWYGPGNATIPPHILKAIDLDEDEMSELVTMNDEREENFNQIADYIEQHLLETPADNTI